jgi:hypothetical protein
MFNKTLKTKIAHLEFLREFDREQTQKVLESISALLQAQNQAILLLMNRVETIEKDLNE